jgi:CRP/FNR family transcriptional regulator
MLTQDHCKLFLSLFPAFKDLDPEMNFRFRQSATYKRLSRKTRIYEAGEACEGVLFILSGMAKVFKRSEKCHDIILHLIHRGEACAVSFSCILDNSLYPATADVEEDMTLVLIPAELFKRLLSNSEAIRLLVSETLSIQSNN